jgi:hypothetical protein
MTTEDAHAIEPNRDPPILEIVNCCVKGRLGQVGQVALHLINELVEFFAWGHLGRRSKTRAIKTNTCCGLLRRGKLWYHPARMQGHLNKGDDALICRGRVVRLRQACG